MCRVGHSFVKASMRESGAIFAGELSGHFYFRFSPTLVADDGIAAFEDGDDGVGGTEVDAVCFGHGVLLLVKCESRWTRGQILNK